LDKLDKAVAAVQVEAERILLLPLTVLFLSQEAVVVLALVEVTPVSAVQETQVQARLVRTVAVDTMVLVQVEQTAVAADL
jgi:hypothetical protein